MPFQIVRNDITKMAVDAIVNAANESLLGGGGVDGAIHRAAGPRLLEECRTLNGCHTGEAKMTRGYDLPARYVIHTVGPVWEDGHHGEPALLASCYRNSLRLAAEKELQSVAFPLISAGVYGYPVEKAVRVATDEIEAFLQDHDMLVYLVVFDRRSFSVSRGLVSEVREYIDDVYAEAHADEEASRRRMNVSRRMAVRPRFPERKKDAPAAPAEAPREATWENLPVAGMSMDFEEAVLPDAAATAEPDWAEMIKKTDEGFSQALLRMIDEKGLTDAACYKRANVDRKLFSKIRSNPAYRPSKPTVFAFAVALELSLPETIDFLHKAGFALTRSSAFDIVMEYFISHSIYRIFEINEVLFQLDMPLLGSGGV